METAAAHAVQDFARFPPIDPVAVAERFGAVVAIRPESLDADNRSSLHHGRLTVKNERWLIETPVRLKAERRRFSVAHEVGHILLFDAVADDPALVQELRSASVWKRIERLCNICAAHLLMPTSTFRAAVDGALPPTQESVESLALQFHVSLEAAARRIPEVHPEWSLIFWQYSTQHRRGPAWRTTVASQAEGREFLPDGLSSSRLAPDVVVQAAADGRASSRTVLADMPGVRRMEDVTAWFVRGSRLELVESDDARQRDRVFLFYRSAPAPTIEA